MSLITTKEVIQYSIVKSGYPQDTITRNKSILEANYFRDLLSIELYDKMKATLVDWSNIPMWDKVFASSPGYSIGNKVVWQELVVQSTVNSNTEEPKINSVKWVEADKFTLSEFRSLWTNHLRGLLANSIIRSSMFFDSITLTAKGATVYTDGDKSQAGADAKTLDLLRRELDNIIDVQEIEMLEYIKKQHNAKVYDYSDVPVIKNTDLIGNGNKTSRRIAFRN